MNVRVIRFLFCLSLLISPIPALAQSSTVTPGNSSPLNTETQPNKETPTFVEQASPYVSAILIAALTVVAAKAKSYAKELTEVEGKTRKKILKEELWEPMPIGPKDKRNAIILVGLGGSGKTTLINCLSQDHKANPGVKTQNYSLFTWLKRASPSAPLHRYYAADHKGQNIGTLISGLIEEQKKPYSPMTWGAINTIIFCVDIAEAYDRGLETEEQYKEKVKRTWRERIDQNTAEWSSVALSAIFGFTAKNSQVPNTNTLKYVCLFINKLDLLPDKEQEIREAYQKLEDNIRKNCSDLDFEVIVGSGKNSMGITQLDQSLMKYSWSNENPS